MAASLPATVDSMEHSLPYLIGIASKPRVLSKGFAKKAAVAAFFISLWN